MIHQLTTSIFDSLNLENPVEQLCDELLEPSPINFKDVFAGIVLPSSKDEEVSSPQCPSPGKQRVAPYGEPSIKYNNCYIYNLALYNGICICYNYNFSCMYDTHTCISECPIEVYTTKGGYTQL